jgi:heme exporter protein D
VKARSKHPCLLYIQVQSVRYVIDLKNVQTYTQLANVVAILMLTLAPLLMLYAHSVQQHRSAMAGMAVSFAAAPPAKQAELKGNWVLVTHVYTQQFLNGQNGPDHVLDNEEGIRNVDIASRVKRFPSDNSKQLYWKLKFRDVGNRVQVISEAGCGRC